MFVFICFVMFFACIVVCVYVCVAHVAAAGFVSRYLNGPLPYVRRHITVNKMC